MYKWTVERPLWNNEYPHPKYLNSDTQYKGWPWHVLFGYANYFSGGFSVDNIRRRIQLSQLARESVNGKILQAIGHKHAVDRSKNSSYDRGLYWQQSQLTWYHRPTGQLVELSRIVRRFVYLPWCTEGRFVYRTREGGGVGLSLKVIANVTFCDDATV